MNNPSDKDYNEGKYSTYKFNEFDSFLRSSLGLYAQESLQSSEIPLVLRGLSRGNIEEVAIFPASKVLKEPPADLYFLYGPINQQIVKDGLIEPRQESNQNNHGSNRVYHEERRDYNKEPSVSQTIIVAPQQNQQTKTRKRDLEGRIAVTNVTKGKVGIVFGKALMGLGLLPPAIGIGSYFLQESQGSNPSPDSIKSLAIIGGVSFGLGLVSYISGKIRNWFWNKNYY